jgi:hypothetical protein
VLPNDLGHGVWVLRSYGDNNGDGDSAPITIAKK